MDSNVSLTKGCFVHKYDGKKKKCEKPLESPNYEQYKKLWETMENKIKSIEKNAYEETFNGLIQFVKQCHLSGIYGVKEIPAAILVMGVNMPDHSNIFSLLENQMHTNDIPATVVLQSKDCSSFSGLMQRLVPGIINKYQMVQGLGNIVLKRNDCTFTKLLSYYENLPCSEMLSPVRSSPRKSPSSKKKAIDSNYQSSPMVLFVQDVEAFTISVLEDLILSCNLYIGKLPLVLVFGMASAMVTLHNVLPPKALCCLGIETFYSMTAIEYLTKIVHEVILDPENPFHLGPRVFKLVVDTVLYHDFSVTNLTSLLKFSILEHFYDNPITTVCCHTTEIKKRLQTLQKSDLASFQNLPSIARFLENNPECKAVRKNENEFKALLQNWLEKLHSHYRLMIIFLNMLHTLTKDLPGYPFGKYLREVYPLALEDSVTSLSCYTLTEKLWKMQSRDELESKVLSCIHIVDQAGMLSKEPYLSEVKDLLNDQLERLQLIKEGDYEKETTVPFESSSEKIMSRSQLQEKLKAQLKARRSKFDQCRDNIVESLSSIFKTLHPPSELPLYEVLYFDNAAAIKRHLMAIPRATLHRNLMNPQAQLKCKCCSLTDNQQITPSMPDICSLYKLHLESGKLINLYDWLEAFKSMKADSGNKREQELSSELDAQLNIRFMHTVSELQLLGFVKSTKRKTDHVARLTFGSF